MRLAMFIVFLYESGNEYMIVSNASRHVCCLPVRVWPCILACGMIVSNASRHVYCLPVRVCPCILACCMIWPCILACSMIVSNASRHVYFLPVRVWPCILSSCTSLAMYTGLLYDSFKCLALFIVFLYESGHVYWLAV